MQRLWDIKNKYYSLVLDDRQLADLAFQGLLPHLKDKYASQEFESLSHLVQRISDQDIKAFELRKAWNKKVSFVDEVGSSNSDEEPVIGLAQWVKNKKPMSCPFVQRNLLLISPKLIGYLISYFRKDRSNCRLIMKFHR